MDGLIYAYHPRSTGQRTYTEQRLAQIAAARRLQQSPHHHSSAERNGSEPTSRTGSSSSSARLRDLRSSAGENMEDLLARAVAGDSTTTSTPSLHSYPGPFTHRTMTEQQEHDLLSNPFEFRHGRRYLRDVPYPLPCDLAEIQRQDLRTLVAITVFGRPICDPRWETETPKKVLDFACGSGYWSTMAHDYFSERGATDVEFTGIDIAPLAPDHTKTGVNWKFLQYDFRRTPLPFEDGEFDIVMLKDASLTNPLSAGAQAVLDDCFRLVKDGGTLEVWDSDYLFRSLPPDAAPAPSRNAREQEIAEETGTFAVAPGYAFFPTQNKYLQNANSWIAQALDQRRFQPTPCTNYASMMLQEECLKNLNQRRVAIPLGELRWERKAGSIRGGSIRGRRVSSGHDSPMSIDSRRKLGSIGWSEALTPDQAALRHTALITVLQMFESMELMLKEVSGKNAEEWSAWWTLMMSDLLDPSRAALTGECLEIGAWSATKQRVGSIMSG